MVGAARRCAGTTRQDAFSFSGGQNGALFVGVANGLGSRPYSQVGDQRFYDRLAAPAGVTASAADLLLEAAEVRALPPLPSVTGLTWPVSRRRSPLSAPTR